MFCRFCGATYPDDSTFCPSCGKSVATTPAPSSAGTAAAATAPAPQPMPAKYEKERKILIAGIVLSLAVAAVALALYLKSSGSGNSSQRDSGQTDVPGLVIDNLNRSRRAANQAGAAANVRTLVSAETIFSLTYPSKGYASNLFQLGPGGTTCVTPHPDAANACLVDFKLGCTDGVSGAFCLKDNYKYEITGVGTTSAITDFVILATPADREAGSKDICATADGLVRWRDNANPPSTPMSTVAECHSWEPI